MRLARLALALALAASPALADYSRPGPMPTAAAGGSAPTATQNNGTASGTSGTSATINLPASIVSGNMLLTFTAMGSGSTSAYDQGSGGEYTETQHGTGTNNDGWTAYKVATGSEGATVTAGWTTSSPHAHATYQIAGTTDTAPSFASAVTGSGTSADPPAVSFTAPALILTAIFLDTSIALSADPSGYAYQCNESSANGQRVRICGCQASVGSDCNAGDPPAWTISGAGEDFIVQTLAVEDN